MAFGNGPWGYQFGGPTQDQITQMRMRSQGVPWQQNRQIYAAMIDGEQAARRFFVPPGEKAILFDKEHPVFYIKEVNEYNAESFEAFKYEPIPSGAGTESDYVTRAELNQILEKLTGLQQQEQTKRECGETQRRRRMTKEDANDGQSGV